MNDALAPLALDVVAERFSNMFDKEASKPVAVCGTVAGPQYSTAVSASHSANTPSTNVWTVAGMVKIPLVSMSLQLVRSGV